MDLAVLQRQLSLLHSILRARSHSLRFALAPVACYDRRYDHAVHTYIDLEIAHSVAGDAFLRLLFSRFVASKCN